MIVLKVKTLRTFREKCVGLIEKPIEPVRLTTRWGIHTFGVPAAIDVLILDNENRVVKLMEKLPPNRIFCWNPMHKTVLELPGGMIAEKRITLGETLTLL